MALSKSHPLFTVQDYLAIERSSLERHEYVDGQIYAMAGESLEHGYITTNLVMVMATQLKGTSCGVLSKDTKVRSGPIPKPGHSTGGLYSYPDLLVICGAPQYHDEHRDIVLNPTVIVEVLSESTEAFDRGEKLRRYQMWNPTLKDYLLVSQERPQIEHYAHQPDGKWLYAIIQGLSEAVEITPIDCQLKLLDVFDRMNFPSANDSEAH